MTVNSRQKRTPRKRSSDEGDFRRKVIASFKATDDFDVWFEKLVRYARLPKSTLIEHALIAYASAQGFDEVPPGR
jgi:hypothetical protein